MDNSFIVRAKHNKEHPYVMISKAMFQDQSLSLKAKGMLGYLLTLPNDWKLHPKQVAEVLNVGKDQVYSVLKELISVGYCKKVAIRDDFGKFIEFEYHFSEEPIFKNDPILENPFPENPEMADKACDPFPGNPDPGNPDTTNKEVNQTELLSEVLTHNNNNSDVVGCSTGEPVDWVVGHVHEYCFKFKKFWSCNEIEFAWSAYEKSKKKRIISDPLAYIEGIINKQRIINKEVTKKETACQKTTTTTTSKNVSGTNKGFYSENDTSESPLAQFALRNGLRTG